MRRLLHVSDIHFGPKHDSRAAAAVMGLVEERKPDLVVISGDLTQRAKPEQFREAHDWVRRLPVPWIAVPGNHDVPLYRVWERVFSPFGAYRDHFQQELEPTFADGELTVAGINTAYNWTFKNGRIDSKRLRDLSTRFAGAERPTAGDLRPTRIAVLHHPLVPGPGFGDQMVLTHAEETAAALAEAGVELVLSGHLHYGYLVPVGRRLSPERRAAFLDRPRRHRHLDPRPRLRRAAQHRVLGRDPAGGLRDQPHRVGGVQVGVAVEASIAAATKRARRARRAMNPCGRGRAQDPPLRCPRQDDLRERSRTSTVGAALVAARVRLGRARPCPNNEHRRPSPQPGPESPTR